MRHVSHLHMLQRDACYEEVQPLMQALQQVHRLNYAFRGAGNSAVTSSETHLKELARLG